VVVKILWSAFPGAYFSGLSDMLECSGGLQKCNGATGQVFHPAGICQTN